MLLACESCHCHHDVGDQEVGAHLRCFCGQLNIVPKQKVRQVRMQHCSNCGGTISEDCTTCEFCDATIALGDRGWGETCPECMARMIKGAKFCGACGIEIRIQARLSSMEDQACPRCKSSLSLCERDRQAFVECTTCGGVWLASENFKRLVEERQRVAVMDLIPNASEPRVTELPPLKRQPVKYLPCPVCSELMNRENFSGASGIVIDWCREHGYWFDLHELEHIQRFVEEGGLERARTRRVERDKRAVARKARAVDSRPITNSRGFGGSNSVGRTGGFFLLELLTGFIEAIFD